MLPGLFLLCGVDCFLYRSEPPVLEGTTNSAWGPPTSIFDQEKIMVLPTFLQDNLVEALSHLRSPVCLCQVNGKKRYNHQNKGYGSSLHPPKCHRRSLKIIASSTISLSLDLKVLATVLTHFYILTPLDLSRKLTLPPFSRLLYQGSLNILWLLDISCTFVQSLRPPSLFSTSGLLLFVPRM